MIEKIEKLIKKIHDLPYSQEAVPEIRNALKLLSDHIDENHFLKARIYKDELSDIGDLSEDLSESHSSKQDRLLQRQIQKKIVNLGRTILDENKKIFIVHGRNINIRDKVSSLIGRLKLDYVILETEHNGGATVIEKFLKNAIECRYAIVLFSADDLGKLENSDSEFMHRTRQNVILELGFFLSQVGRKNIAILHETGKKIEKPSDFDGFVYEAFDEYGAWKSKLIKEMKKAGIYIDEKLSDRI